jgi:N-acetylmuramoyl-L-alanine amidase
MKVRNHRLVLDDGSDAAFEATPNRGGAMTPRYLIMHYTAGSSAESSIRHMQKPSAKASAHLVIGRDGAVTQMVPFNRVAWHAGRSRWLDIKGLNRHAIGIELDNAGPMEGGPGAWRSWFGRTYADDDVMVARHKFEDVERGWHRYPEAQLEAALSAAEALVAHYGLRDVLGHDDIAPERKQDPGPAFPMAHFQGALIGRGDDGFDLYETTASLNVREGPGTGFGKLAGSPVPKGTRVESELREGSWHHVEVLDADGAPDMTGWVHGNFLRPVADDG